jgi:tetratricopeptide (TPR) repeat protein
MNMETYRLSSKLRENEREYLIQTTNDVSQGAVATTVFVDGVRTDTYSCPYPDELSQADLLALVKQTHGDWKMELEGLLQACQRISEQGDSDAMFRLSTALYYRKFYREAADLLSGITRLNPEHHQTHHLLARTSLALGQTAEAVRSATEAVQLRPGYADYRNSLAEALLTAGAVAEAIAELEAAISINLYYGEAYFNLGLARTFEVSRTNDPEQRNKGVERSADCFKKAQLIHPELGDQTDYRDGLNALANRDFAAALNLLKRVRESYREYRRREFMAANRRILMPDDSLTGEALNEQIRSLRDQLASHPNYLDLQTELARCYFELAGRMWDQGIEECRRIVETHPGMTQVAEAMQQAVNIRSALTGTVAAITGKG